MTVPEHRTALDRLLEPTSIAIVGASNDSGKRGNQILRSLLESGYEHMIYPVNPKGGTILGLAVTKSVAQLPEGIDVAVVARPAEAVPAVIRECGERQIAGAVVLANGFKEAGEHGARLEDDVHTTGEENGVRIIGPNTSGTLSLGVRANLVGVPELPPAGPISIVTQSGNMLLSLLADQRVGNIPGIDVYAGLGNQVDVSYEECVGALALRPSTQAIIVHAEGLRDGQALLTSASRAATQCPIVLLRGGRSEAGQRSALSHTGSVAVPGRVAADVIRQAGVTQVDRSDELAAVAGVLATAPLPIAGRGVAILSDGGGHATLAADALTAAGVSLAPLSEQTRERLRHLLGKDAIVTNPVDVASAHDAHPAVFVDAIDDLLQDPHVGTILVVGLYGGYHLRFNPAVRATEDASADQIVARVRDSGVPVIVHSCYADVQPESHRRLRAGPVPVLGSLDHAVRGTQALIERADWLATATHRVRAADRSAAAVQGLPPPTLMSEPAARTKLESAGLEVGAWHLARSAPEAAAAVGRLGGLCAMKVASPHIAHKSDAGGVKLNVTSSTVDEDYQALLKAVAYRVPDALVEGVVVTPMADPGVELLIGATTDPVFGPIVSFGAGGVLVEALDDIAFRAAPLSKLEAEEMISQTRVARLLAGHRHFERLDSTDLASLLVEVGRVVTEVPELAELDLNPVIANSSGLHLVDVRLTTSPSRTERDTARSVDSGSS